MSDLEALKKQIRIRSGVLSTWECYTGTNSAYWSIKFVYHALGLIQEELRAEKNYRLADQVRSLRTNLRKGYEYRIRNDIDQLVGETNV